MWEKRLLRWFRLFGGYFIIKCILSGSWVRERFSKMDYIALAPGQGAFLFVLNG